MVCWFVGWFVGSLVCLFVGCLLVGWSVYWFWLGCLFDRFLDCWLVGCFVDLWAALESGGLVGCLVRGLAGLSVAYWLVGRLLVGWVVGW